MLTAPAICSVAATGAGGGGCANEVAAATTPVAMIRMRCFVFMPIVISTSVPAPNGAQLPRNQDSKNARRLKNVRRKDDSCPHRGHWRITSRALSALNKETAGGYQDGAPLRCDCRHFRGALFA